MTNMALILMCMTVCTVTAQTFQYSRGWTNGKRDGIRNHVLGRIFSPCQLMKLKYILDGKPIDERFYAPCEYHNEDLEAPSKRYKTEPNQETLFEVFQ
ncbi:PREDICTED: pro-corazonin-like [Papilio polytes]|uniref:pro-corazonin-like n=1 Tax=Papilio polytes TaxID=76194 RepID=UPI0006766FB5|nr:PREDICTED: pro-corazonin-like [Papilio polytes]